MDIQEEKILLLRGIQKLTRGLAQDPSLEVIQRYSNLVACLVTLNWKECGSREGEGLHIASKHN